MHSAQRTWEPARQVTSSPCMTFDSSQFLVRIVLCWRKCDALPAWHVPERHRTIGMQVVWRWHLLCCCGAYICLSRGAERILRCEWHKRLDDDGDCCVRSRYLLPRRCPGSVPRAHIPVSAPAGSMRALQQYMCRWIHVDQGVQQHDGRFDMYRFVPSVCYCRLLSLTTHSASQMTHCPPFLCMA